MSFYKYHKQNGRYPAHQERTLGVHPAGVFGKNGKCGPEFHSSSKPGGPEGKTGGPGARARSTPGHPERGQWPSNVREQSKAEAIPRTRGVLKRPLRKSSRKGQEESNLPVGTLSWMPVLP